MAAGSPVPFRPTGADRPFPSWPGGTPTGGRRFLGVVAAGLMAAVGLVIFVGALIVIATLFVVAIAAALAVVAVRGIVHAISPHHGGHPVRPGAFGPASVIESTATVIRRATPKTRV
jgi:hypothetical protein